MPQIVDGVDLNHPPNDDCCCVICAEIWMKNFPVAIKKATRAANDDGVIWIYIATHQALMIESKAVVPKCAPYEPRSVVIADLSIKRGAECVNLSSKIFPVDGF